MIKSYNCADCKPDGKKCAIAISYISCVTEKNAALHTCHGIIKVRKSLLTVCGELESEEFIFIERGCIINLIHLTQIKNSSVYLRDGTILPISRSHLQDVKMAVNSYWGKHI